MDNQPHKYGHSEEEAHTHGEGCCGHHTEPLEDQHVFVRADLLRNYQTLENIAAQITPQIIEEPFEVQMDCLVGVFENYMKETHSSLQNQLQRTDHHEHGESCGHNKAHNHDHGEECHHGYSHMSNKAIYEEELELDKKLLDYRQKIHSEYKPLHPDLYHIEKWEIDPSVKALILKHPAHLELQEPIQPVKYSSEHPLLRLMPLPNATQLEETQDDFLDTTIRSMLKEEFPGVYSFDFLAPAFCTRFLDEIKHFETWCDANKVRVHRPNSMNNYGAILDDFGFEPVLEQLVSQYMNVLSSILYPHISATLDHHHGFVVTYGMGKDEKLDVHVDDADVTLNVCLGKEFTKGELYFAGVRCQHHQSKTRPLPEEEHQLQHFTGKAIIHLGRHRHAASPITSGERHNLILWCRSSKFRTPSRLFDCPDWCGISQMLDHAADDSVLMEEAAAHI